MLIVQIWNLEESGNQTNEGYHFIVYYRWITWSISDTESGGGINFVWVEFDFHPGTRKQSDRFRTCRPIELVFNCFWDSLTIGRIELYLSQKINSVNIFQKRLLIFLRNVYAISRFGVDMINDCSHLYCWNTLATIIQFRHAIQSTWSRWTSHDSLFPTFMIIGIVLHKKRYNWIGSYNFEYWYDAMMFDRVPKTKLFRKATNYSTLNPVMQYIVYNNCLCYGGMQLRPFDYLDPIEENFDAEWIEEFQSYAAVLGQFDMVCAVDVIRIFVRIIRRWYRPTWIAEIRFAATYITRMEQSVHTYQHKHSITQGSNWRGEVGILTPSFPVRSIVTPQPPTPQFLLFCWPLVHFFTIRILNIHFVWYSVIFFWISCS